MSSKLPFTLYYFPPSSFSQKAVLALNALNLPYEERIVNLFEGEQLEEWYLDVNSKGEVPVLVDPNADNATITDSADILQYLNDEHDQRPGGVKLIPNPVTPLGRQVAETNQMLCAVKMFVLTFGAASHPQHCQNSKLSAEESAGRTGMLEKGLKILETKMATAKSPYKECYTYKLTKLSTGKALLTDEEKLLDEIDTTLKTLTRINELLAQKKGVWLLSDSPTIADITLIVLLKRIHLLGLQHHFFAETAPLQDLQNYYERASEAEFVKKTYPS